MSKGYEQLDIVRTWAMPNGNTFKIEPIRNLVRDCCREVGFDAVIVDPFANMARYGTITNDLNPEYDTDYHMDALEFLRTRADEEADLVLYDPPYSITQAAQLYDSYGKEKLERSVSNMGYWAQCKNEVARITKYNGLVLCCGWNSNGCGINRGFTLEHMLIVAHGGSKNDTIVTVERKTKRKQLKLFEKISG